MPEVVAVIPARLDSRRLPGKVLRPLRGVPMLERVYRRVAVCPELARVVVATEDEEIVQFCNDRGIPVELTSKHPSGTDRIAELSQRTEADLFVNVQGDQPLFDPRQMAALLAVFRRWPEALVGTLVAPLPEERATSPSTVKVALAADGRALYFSRAPIPHGSGSDLGGRWQHIGLYAYTRSALTSFMTQGPSPLERMETLEQLRFLEAGVPIHVGITDLVTPSVDTLEDALFVEERLGAEVLDGGPNEASG
jgi:3-deoxy-manno-octulosonate cytidylyltransferase (CMP-KDO synthetase)